MSDSVKFGVSVFLLFILILLSAQLQSLQQESEISSAYIDFYLNLRNIVLPVLMFATIWSLTKSIVNYYSKHDWSPSFGSLYSSNVIAHPLADSSFGYKLMVFGALVLSSTGGVMLINSLVSPQAGSIVFFPIPQAINPSFQITEAKSIYLSSVIPGFFEDGLYNLIVSSIIYSLISWIAFRLGADLTDKRVSISLIVLSCLISSAGVSIWVIPGFSSAHQVYSSNAPAFISVFLFGFTSALLNLLFGMFGSFVAHVLHNAVISMAVAFNIKYFGVTLDVVNRSTFNQSIFNWLVIGIVSLPYIALLLYNKFND